MVSDLPMDMGMKGGVHGHEGGVDGHEGEGSMGMRGGPWA